MPPRSTNNILTLTSEKTTLLTTPLRLDDLIPRKRVHLSMRLNPKPASTSLFAAFLRMPDHLVSTAHFRPEARRRSATADSAR
jgi:hypothetical protein